jgi:hypothetical protein
LTIHVDATTAKVTTTTRHKKATPALEHPATVDGAKDKDTPTLMQLECPPEVKMQQNSTTEVTQTLLQLKDPPMFETWQHGTPDAALTLLRLKEAPEIDTLQHATASSIVSQLKDNNDYNSCVKWPLAAASAGCNAEYDSNIEANFEPLAADRLKKPAAKATNDVVYGDDELFQDDTPEDNAEEDMEYYCVNSTGRRGRSLSSSGPPRPDTSGMSPTKAQEAIKEWRVLRKAHTDKMQREHRRLFGSNATTEIEYSGVVDARLWLMSDVEVKAILLIRIAEEANFCGCQIAIVQSNNYQVYVRGCAGSLFKIKAFCSVKLGWKVTTIQTREATGANDDSTEEIVYDGEEEVADEDKASLEEDDADGKVKAVRQCNPIKSRWIVPLLLNEIAEKPNMSNAEMKHVISTYVKEKFITSALWQNARTMARDEISGDPATYLFFANGLVEKMKECGVDVKVLMKDRQQVLRMLECVVLSDHMRKNKAEGKLMIDCNCDVLPLSLEDLLNYTTLMLKFCTNKPIWASLLRQVFFGGGKGAFHPQKKV